MLATMPVASSTATLTMAAREKRGTTSGERGDAAAGFGRGGEHEQAQEPADPDRRRRQVGPVEGEHQPDRAGRRRVARQAGKHQHRRGTAAGPDDGEQCLARAPGTAGPVERERDRGRQREQREHGPEIAERAPEAESRTSGTMAPRSVQGLSENSAVASTR